MIIEGLIPTGNGGRGLRIPVNEFALVELPKTNSARLLNVSEGGMAIQAREVFERGRAVEFAVTLPQSEVRLEGHAEVAWSDPSGRAGLKFARVSPFDHFRLQQWIQSRHGAAC